jgi:hypothetical protein
VATIDYSVNRAANQIASVSCSLNGDSLAACGSLQSSTKKPKLLLSYRAVVEGLGGTNAFVVTITLSDGGTVTGETTFDVHDIDLSAARAICEASSLGTNRGWTFIESGTHVNWPSSFSNPYFSCGTNVVLNWTLDEVIALRAQLTPVCPGFIEALASPVGFDVACWPTSLLSKSAR